MTITYATGRTALALLSRDWALWPECGCPQGVATITSDPERFAYLFDPALPVRPPTAEEAADYATRVTDPKWRDIYAQGLPALPAVPEAPAEPAPKPEAPAGPLEPLPATQADEAADRAQADSEAALARWGATDTIPAVPAAEGEGE